MQSLDVSEFLKAARARIASEGYAGLNLRSVAQDAGTSLGSLSYRVGDKAALIAQIVNGERGNRAAIWERWQARARYLDFSQPSILAQVIVTSLDDLALAHREGSLVGCELLLEAGRTPDAFPGMADIVDHEDSFWTEALALWGVDDANLAGRAIAAYCRDELPFTLAVGHVSDYRLLRAATAARLAERFAPATLGLTDSFDDLVEACGDESASSRLRVDLPPGSRKAELAAHIAAIIAAFGPAGVTHRAVAASAETSNSSVAHYFRTTADLIEAGMGALILGMRDQLDAITKPDTETDRGLALVRATHSVALLAARDPSYRPYALDMRRRRAENVRADVAAQMRAGNGVDRAATQAAVMVMIGSALANLARGSEDLPRAITPDALARLASSKRARP